MFDQMYQGKWEILRVFQEFNADLTSMIGLCQEGKSSPDALGRSAGAVSVNSSARPVASRQWFLFVLEPDFHLLSQTSEWS